VGRAGRMVEKRAVAGRAERRAEMMVVADLGALVAAPEANAAAVMAAVRAAVARGAAADKVGAVKAGTRAAVRAAVATGD